MAFAFDGLFRLVGISVFAEINDGNVCALAHKDHGNRAAEAAVAAGNQNSLVAESARALIKRRILHRCRRDARLPPQVRQILFRARSLRRQAESSSNSAKQERKLLQSHLPRVLSCRQPERTEEGIIRMHSTRKSAFWSCHMATASVVARHNGCCRYGSPKAGSAM